jgi:hypothetical protein
MRALSESSFLVTISGYGKAIYFSETSGGSKKASSSEYNDGLIRGNKKIRGNFTVDDLTLSRAFDPDTDPEFIRYLEKHCSLRDGDLTITVQPIEPCTESNPIGAPFIYSGCLFLGYDAPEVKRSGNGASMVKYSFSVDNLSI